MKPVRVHLENKYVLEMFKILYQYIYLHNIFETNRHWQEILLHKVISIIYIELIVN